MARVDGLAVLRELAARKLPTRVEVNDNEVLKAFRLGLSSRKSEGGSRVAAPNRCPPKARLDCAARFHVLHRSAASVSLRTSARKRAKPRSSGPRLSEPCLGRRHVRHASV